MKGNRVVNKCSHNFTPWENVKLTLDKDFNRNSKTLSLKYKKTLVNLGLILIRDNI